MVLALIIQRQPFIATGFGSLLLLRHSARAFSTVPSTAMAPPPPLPSAAVDPHAWLEDVLGAKPLAWVEEGNRRAIADVGDPKETACYTTIKEILDSKVRAR